MSVGMESEKRESLTVTTGLGCLPRLLKYGSGRFTDTASSSDPKSAPIVCGIWTVDDILNGDSIFTAETDEVKFVTRGQSTWKDIATGKITLANEGDMIWFPKGSSSTLLSCQNLSAFYVEACHREVTRVQKPAVLIESLLDSLITRLTESYVASNQKSREALDKAAAHLPGSNTRSVLHYDPFPMVLVSGRNCHVSSADGREYVDFVSEYSAGMLGHSHPEVARVVQSTLARGIGLGGPSIEEANLAAKLTARFPSMDKVRFCNSGTEANTMAILAARHFTKKNKLLAFKRGYHGGFLGFGEDGPLATTLPFDFIVGTFNDATEAEQLVNDNARDLAAILVEPVQGSGGLIAAEPAFLHALRSAASRVGAILIFDEVVTSRLHHGGMQSYHGVIPDMTTAGKFLGGGFSFGVFGGRSDIMDLFDPRNGGLSHSGTFNNNAFSMSAGAVACDLVTPDVIALANRLGDRLRDGINEAGRLTASDGQPPLIRATGFGSMVGIHFSGPLASKLSQAFFLHMLAQGIYLGRRGFVAINMMHRDEHVTRALDAVRGFLEEIMTEDVTKPGN